MQMHIVCLDAPSPPDYGGALDMHYKIKALANEGAKISLHYFAYRDGRSAKGLEDCCDAIYPYSRKSFLKAPPLRQPFIVHSRINAKLIDRLNSNAHPVLLEGLHCAGIIPFLKNPQRVVLRMHNNEPAYYRYLAKTESSFLKKQYLLREGKLLRRFQQSLDKNIKLACLSQTDEDVFREPYGFQQTAFVPCFHPWDRIQILPGTGDYCLYHGNLLVSENEQAALWLLRNVFHSLKTKLIIAGRGASVALQHEAAKLPNVSVVNNPSIAEIDRLVREAHVNVLPSLNNTGVKLKLLNALFNGRHCLTNFNGIKGSGIEEGVHVAETPGEWISAVSQLMQQPFSEQDAANRVAELSPYNNAKNAAKLIGLW